MEMRVLHAYRTKHNRENELRIKTGTHFDKESKGIFDFAPFPLLPLSSSSPLPPRTLFSIHFFSISGENGFLRIEMDIRLNLRYTIRF